ncbi:isocitrate lyase, partial [Serratia bockelmannii]|nr:isocitrate lyase [Serratia bockelmannii]
MNRNQQIKQLESSWNDARWEGITRPYSAEEVISLRGSVNPACTLAERGANKLWSLLNGES